MSQSRILPLLGPAVVLYLAADVASVHGGLSVVGGAVMVLAALLSLTPFATRGRAEVRGARRVAALGVCGALALLAAVELGEGSLAAGIAARLGAAVAGALVVDLAMTVPRGLASAASRRLMRGVVFLAAMGCMVAGSVAIAPAFELAGRVWLLPPSLKGVPFVFAMAAAALALAARLWHRRASDDPLALASNAWAVMGLLPAAVIAPAGLVLVAQGYDDWGRGAAALAVGLAVAGHVALVDPRRRLHADRTSRRASSAVLTLAALVALAWWAQPLVPADPTGLAVAVAVALVLAVPVYGLMSPMVHRVLAPDRGRLLDAIARIEAGLGTVCTLDELARTVLGPLRDASRAPDATPVLYTVHPPLELSIDAAREPHVRARSLSETLQSRLLERPEEVLVRGGLEGHVVRRPDLRPLVNALVELDALCVVPLRVGGELEGALAVPAGRRRSLPTLEEIHALEGLGHRLEALVVLLSAQERARARTAEALRARDVAEERVEALEDQVAHLRGEARVLRAGRGASRLLAPQVAYAPAMRALEQRIQAVAPLDAPVLLVAEGGTPVDQVARWIHDTSGRADGPFVVADCGSVRPEQTLAALFGSEDPSAPGWLQLAAGGTLLLADVPALSLEAQAAVAEAMAEKLATAVGGPGAYPVDVRVVATSRVDLGPLVCGGAFDAELGRWLDKLRVEVPPLRERKEDLPSLALLALDRACRVLGREVMGMEQEALDVLLRHDWPGNLRELQHVIDRAVAQAEGPQVRREDLPPLTPTSSAGDPLAGTYATIEERILRRAMERAEGNKSQAARMLGLKRTTFLDKLRRHHLDEPGKGPAAKPGRAEEGASSR
ncbi:MAG: sigma 54-interacting transcriptional regulator [Myxococcota bacterium]